MNIFLRNMLTFYQKAVLLISLRVLHNVNIIYDNNIYFSNNKRTKKSFTK